MRTETKSKTCNGVMCTLSLKSVTLVLIASNIALVSILAVTIGLHRKLHQPAACSKGTDGDGIKKEYSRYCFRAEKEECLERGFDSKKSGNDTVCCGNLNDHVYSLASEVRLSLPLSVCLSACLSAVPASFSLCLLSLPLFLLLSVSVSPSPSLTLSVSFFQSLSTPYHHNSAYFKAIKSATVTH